METLLFDTLLAVGVALCPLGILVLLLWFVLSVAIPLHQQLMRLKRLKSTPCDRCYYFSLQPELQCAVHPHIVLTKLARNCRDFDPELKPSSFSYNRQTK